MTRYYFTTFTASGAVLTATDHGLYENDTIIVESTGTLPTGLAVDTTYYVLRDGITTSTFKVSASKGGDPISTSGGSGSHTFLKTNHDKLQPMYENNR